MMGLDAYQKVSAIHQRRVIDTETDTSTLTSLGTIWIFGDALGFELDTAEGIELSVATFQITFKPSVDLRVGDLLTIAGISHEVTEIIKPSYPIPNYIAQATLKRQTSPGGTT
jgi:hypothetical protein